MTFYEQRQDICAECGADQIINLSLGEALSTQRNAPTAAYTLSMRPFRRALPFDPETQSQALNQLDNPGSPPALSRQASFEIRHNFTIQTDPFTVRFQSESLMQ